MSIEDLVYEESDEKNSLFANIQILGNLDVKHNSDEDVKASIANLDASTAVSLYESNKLLEVGSEFTARYIHYYDKAGDVVYKKWLDAEVWSKEDNEVVVSKVKEKLRSKRLIV